MLLFVACFFAGETFAGTVRISGIPSRRYVIVQQVFTPAESGAKLPPPVAPGIDETFSAAEKDPALEKTQLEAKPPRTAPKDFILDEATEKKIRKSAEKERLNSNALRWQEKRADEGSLSAMRSLGLRYIKADGVERDISRGLDLLRKAAAGGDSIAIAELSRLEPAKKD